MWYGNNKHQRDWSEAARHLRRIDPVLDAIIRRYGPCTLPPRRDYFIRLIQAILAQQVSTQVATVFFYRFRRLYPHRHPTPTRVLKTADTTLRSIGLSRQKMRYVKELAKAFASGQIAPRRFSGMPDDQIAELLMGVPGIGRWTADIFLMFCLNRPDVLPVGDLGLQKCVQAAYGLATRPTPQQLFERAELWRPWRTIATWYLWRGVEQE